MKKLTLIAIAIITLSSCKTYIRQEDINKNITLQTKSIIGGDTTSHAASFIDEIGPEPYGQSYKVGDTVVIGEENYGNFYLTVRATVIKIDTNKEGVKL